MWFLPTTIARFLAAFFSRLNLESLLENKLAEQFGQLFESLLPFIITFTLGSSLAFSLVIFELTNLFSFWQLHEFFVGPLCTRKVTLLPLIQRSSAFRVPIQMLWVRLKEIRSDTFVISFRFFCSRFNENHLNSGFFIYPVIDYTYKYQRNVKTHRGWKKRIQNVFVDFA